MLYSYKRVIDVL